MTHDELHSHLIAAGYTTSDTLGAYTRQAVRITVTRYAVCKERRESSTHDNRPSWKVTTRGKLKEMFVDSDNQLVWIK